MVFIETLLSYSKLLLCLFLIGIAFFNILFRIMSGGMFYYYSRTSDFNNKAYGVIHARNVSKKFEPVFKKVKILPLDGKLLIEGLVLRDKKIRRLEYGPIDHEMLFR